MRPIPDHRGARFGFLLFEHVPKAESRLQPPSLHVLSNGSVNAGAR